MNKSFTLIEMLAVILIIGFLSSFIVVHLDSVGGLFKDRRGAAFSNFLKNELLMNLVSEWRLDGDSNDSWMLNNGTMNNFSADPWKQGSDCIMDSCLSFDGEDDWINCGHDVSLDFYDEITIEAWIKITGNRLGVHTCPIIKGVKDDSSWMFYVDSERNPNRNVCFAGMKSDNSDWLFWLKAMYSLGEWFHMTGTFSSSQGFAKVYKNGEMTDRLDEGIQGSTLHISVDKDLRIGYIWEDGYYLGEIDQVRIYNAALTISQVESNYYAGINRMLIDNKLTKAEFIQKIGGLNNN
ncbi:MAG: hypothetical protein MCSN_4010 [Candidatus Microsyncoccus archaeolyticus]|nr:MAG: hypothetical protein MCSN_4010 [Candidatus Parcubacteria bacterium]